MRAEFARECAPGRVNSCFGCIGTAVNQLCAGEASGASKSLFVSERLRCGPFCGSNREGGCRFALSFGGRSGEFLFHGLNPRLFGD